MDMAIGSLLFNFAHTQTHPIACDSLCQLCNWWRNENVTMNEPIHREIEKQPSFRFASKTMNGYKCLGFNIQISFLVVDHWLEAALFLPEIVGGKRAAPNTCADHRKWLWHHSLFLCVYRQQIYMHLVLLKKAPTSNQRLERISSRRRATRISLSGESSSHRCIEEEEDKTHFHCRYAQVKLAGMTVPGNYEHVFVCLDYATMI